MSSFADVLKSIGGVTDLPTSHISANVSKPKASGATATRPENRPDAIPDRSLKRRLGTNTGDQTVTVPWTQPATTSNKSTTGVSQGQPHLETSPPHNQKTVTSKTIPIQPALVQDPPPKGSYRELLVRAAAAKLSSPIVGQIKHKAVVKQPKLFKAAETQSKVSLNGVNKPRRLEGGHGSSRIMASASRRNISQAPGLFKQRRKPLELDYKGTMRPSNTITPHHRTSTKPLIPEARYNKGSSSGVGFKDPLRRTNVRLPAGRRYDSDSGESGDCDISDDESGGIGGGGFHDLVDEEDESTRAALQEDAAAARQELEHKRRKAEKKRGLKRLAAKRELSRNDNREA